MNQQKNRVPSTKDQARQLELSGERTTYGRGKDASCHTDRADSDAPGTAGGRAGDDEKAA
jgi:hypothetical protein